MTELESKIEHDSFFPVDEAASTQAVDEQPGRVTGEGEKIRSEEARLAAVMSYIPFLCFVPLMTMRENPEAIFHARQGLILFLIEIAAAVLTIDKVADFLFRAILVLAIAATACGVYLALQGRHYRLPIVGSLAEKAQL